MTKKEHIIVYYYEKKLNIITIAQKLNVSKQYVSKIIKTDIRYIEEKNRRKEESATRQRKRNIECIKRNRSIRKNKNERLDAFLNIQHIQDCSELSGRRIINNRAFKKWNTSIYEFHNRTKEFRLKEEFKRKTSYAVPKKIKWN